MFALYRFLHQIAQPLLITIGLPPHSCRFNPSCSKYCEIAYNRFGPIKGTFYCIKRIIRCRPGAAIGSDPVPQSPTL